MVRDDFILGINAGGLGFTDSLGNFYLADTFGVANSYTTSLPIEGTTDDILYQSESWMEGGFTYEISISPGTYYVELNFAEIFWRIDSIGERVFDVSIEGVLIEDNFDIFSSAGGAYTAYAEGYFVDVTDGALTLTFSSEVQNPKLNAFSVWSVAADGADLTAPLVEIAYSGAQSPNEDLLVVVTYSDETELDTTSIANNQLTAAGPGEYAVTFVDLVFSSLNKVATATYTVSQDSGWTSDPLTLAVAGGEVADTAGNTNLASSTTFQFAGTDDTTAPLVEIAYSGGKTPGEALTVVVTYTDETALETDSIGTNELVASGIGNFNVTRIGLVVSPDNKTVAATYEVRRDGGWTTDPVMLAIAAGDAADTSGNTNLAAASSFVYVDPLAGILAVDSYTSGEIGAARILVTPNSGVQSSTYGLSSFSIENAGDKRIAAVFFDISNALLTDAVFDPVGLAGDSVARGLTFGSLGDTGAIAPGSNSLEPFYGTGGTAGYEGMLVRFDPNTNGGFQKGEITRFGVDLDANSIVGIPQKPVDVDGKDPRLNAWDIGGVSGAELTGARIEVLFTDGSRATGQLVGDGSEGGAIAYVSDTGVGQLVELSVNGASAGESGLYGLTNSVLITGPAGETARIVMIQGFAQPFDYVDSNGILISTADRLAASNDPFLANNALRVQTVEVVLDGSAQDITHHFDFAPPGGTLAFPGDSQIPAAFSAVVLSAPGGDPAGVVSAPIYLQSGLAADITPPTVLIELSSVSNSQDPMTVTVTYSDDIALDFDTIQLADLSIISAGPSVDVLGSSLATSPDGLSATATYTLLPQGGWTTDAVTFSVTAGAIKDVASNPNALASQSYTFTQSSGVVVNSLAEMTQLALQGVNLKNPTSIDVGADGRLYVSQQDGLIVALTIEKSSSYDSNGNLIVTWAVTDRENITLIQEMPNHNDQGVYEPGVGNRQVTGLMTSTDADGNVMLFVGSSDPRIGGGGSGADKNLDTNSGVLSRLTQVDDGTGNLVWEKVDLVRGLPRSEENHSINGMELTTDPNGNEIILLTVGGFTNTGAQSNNFAYTPEYYYSASVVGIDLNKLAQLEATEGLKTYTPPGGSASHDYLFDLPTLDDPTRVNGPGGDLAGDGSTTADVFGGNNGLNQAIYDPSGIVTVLYSGFRNHYDIVVTPGGQVYTVDNGSNTGWGGVPLNANGQVIVDADGNGLADNGPAVNLSNNAGFANADSLLRIDDDIWTIDTEMYYGGHPNLYRAWGPDAGFYLYATANNTQGWAAGTPLGYDTETGQFYAATAPIDLGYLIANANEISGQDGDGNPLTDPQQELFLGTDGRIEGKTDTPNGALYTFFSSTNGLDIVKSQGELYGALITVSFNGSIYALPMLADGTVDTANVQSRALTSKPLDLVTQGNDDPFPGVIFVAAYGADQIVILSPDESQGVLPNPNDRDGDGIDDTIDPFAADPDNGLLDKIEPGAVLTWTFVNGEPFPNDREALFDGTGGLYNGGDIGFTGIMTNRGGLPESLYVQENIIFGGAPGVLQVKSVDAGDATTNTQRNGFQLGTTIGEGLESFTVTSLIDNYLDELEGFPAGEKLSQGIFIGSGDQSNFVSVSLVKLADDRVGFEVISQFAFDFIGAITPEISFYEVPELALAGSLDTVTLGLDVTVATASVTPTWTYMLGGIAASGSGAAVTLAGDALAALEGTLTLPDNTGGQVPTGLAVGVMSSRSDAPTTAGGAVAAIVAGGDESFTAIIDGTNITFVPDATAANVTIVGTTLVYAVSGTTNITNSDLDELHTEERYAASDTDWGYSIDTGDGTFLVDLYFAEIWSGAFAPGARVFDIIVEGDLIADNFDIYQVAGGGNLETIVSTIVEVNDGTLDILFSKEVQNAKVSAVLVRNAESDGVFAADWDNLEIRGYGTPPADLTNPTATIAVGSAVTQDEVLTVAVTYTDNVALDPTSIDEGDLTVTANTPFESTYSLEVLPNGTQATATYVFLPAGGSWDAGDEFVFNVAAGVVIDTSQNPNDPASEARFVYDIVAPVVALSISGGTTAINPITVLATYTDDVALDHSTIEVGDLILTGGDGQTYTVLDGTLSIVSPKEATVTYSILQDGGWTGDPLEVTIAAGAASDAKGQGNTATSATFIFEVDEAPIAALSLSGGSTETDPLIVVATYTDDLGLDLDTVEITDLSITGVSGATYTLQSATKQVVSATEATVTYEILQEGGWTTGPVEFSIGAGAVTDTSAQGNAATSTTFEFNPASDNFVFAVNAGGPEYTDSRGITYQKDDFGAGNSYKTTVPIEGTEDDVLFQSETWKTGGFVYDIPVANGVYTVELLFAEIFNRIDTPGERVFDVYIEDQLVFDDLDILLAAGGQYSALTLYATVEVLDGSLTLATTPEAQNPKINAFIIWEDADGIA